MFLKGLMGVIYDTTVLNYLLLEPRPIVLHARERSNQANFEGELEVRRKSKNRRQKCALQQIIFLFFSTNLSERSKAEQAMIFILAREVTTRKTWA